MSGPDGFSELLAEYVRSLMEAEAAIIEQACEAAIQGGEHGVLIWRNSEGRLVQVCVSEAVPYGYRYVHILDQATCDAFAVSPLVSPVLPRSPSGGV